MKPASTLELSELAWAARGRRLVHAERLAGGTSKGVYRLTMDDGTAAIAYRWAPLARDDLDEARLALGLLAERLSLVAGPLRLLESDFPDREFLHDIVRWNGEAALNLI